MSLTITLGEGKRETGPGVTQAPPPCNVDPFLSSKGGEIAVIQLAAKRRREREGDPH